MRGSIVRREGAKGPLYYVVLQGRWYKVPNDQTQQSAELYQAHLVVELAQGGPMPTKRQALTVAAFAEHWLETRAAEWAAQTAKGNRNYVVNAIAPHLGARRLDSLTQEDILRWRGLLQERYAPGSVKQAMSVLRALLGAAVEWRYLRAHPMAGVRRPRVPKRGMSFLTPAQLRQLLQVLPDAQARALVLTTATGGLRRGEVLAARWRHLDTQVRTYDVRETMIQVRGPATAQAPKTERSQGKVVLSPAAVRALEEHRALQAARRQWTAGWVDEDFIFTDARGKPLPSGTLHSAWQSWLKAAGLPGTCRFHDLRHTCAALLIDQGAHPKLIQEQLRHASMSTTMDIYGHLFPHKIDEAVARLDQVLGLAV